MAEMCRAETLEDEFFVQTWSGNDQRPICAVQGDAEISHFVQVINLKLYSPKRVRCEGIIASSQPLICFTPDQPDDTPTYWRRYLKRLDDDTQEETISACILEVVTEANGVENIDTVVTVEWIQSGKTQTVSLPLKVSTD